MSILDASFLEVSVYYVKYREFLVLTHNIPRIIISEKQQQKQHGVFGTYSSSNMPLLASRLILIVTEYFIIECFVSDPVYVSWISHSAHPCPVSYLRHNHIAVPIPLCLCGVHAESTAVQPVSDCNSTCIFIQSTYVTVQPTSEHCTSCNIVQPVYFHHTCVQSVSNHHITLFKCWHQQHFKCCQLDRPTDKL
jgi:hypothetical protein